MSVSQLARQVMSVKHVGQGRYKVSFDESNDISEISRELSDIYTRVEKVNVSPSEPTDVKE